MHHHDHLVVIWIVVLPLAWTDLHLLGHQCRRSKLLLDLLDHLRVLLLPSTLRGADVADSVSLAHELIRLWHFHKTLSINFAVAVHFTLIVRPSVRLKLIDEIVLSVIRVFIVVHILKPAFLLWLLCRQVL